jgi:hypothetical protein
VSCPTAVVVPDSSRPWPSCRDLLRHFSAAQGALWPCVCRGRCAPAPSFGSLLRSLRCAPRVCSACPTVWAWVWVWARLDLDLGALSGASLKRDEPIWARHASQGLHVACLRHGAMQPSGSNARQACVASSMLQVLCFNSVVAVMLDGTAVVFVLKACFRCQADH